ncbi:acetolactate synthase large subunit [Maridesulfovibrio bastinii]|uniref:acetolactate synthase large subunit n=1 Tax=Maridesulfovibrio bastinii TaxID=47157 RepID=UPI0004220B75
MANIHNARKSGSPLVNIIGDHATYHERYNAPLTSNVQGFCSSISDWVCRPRSARTVAADAARAVQASRQTPGKIASLILPADTAWLEAERPAPRLEIPKPAAVSAAAIEGVAKALSSGKKTAILIRGEALYSEKGLTAAGRIANETGSTLFCDTFTPRARFGRGLPKVEPLHYRGKDILSRLGEFEQLLLVGAEPPVSFFAYPDQKSWLTPPECKIITLSHPHEDGSSALSDLAEVLGAAPWTDRPAEEAEYSTDSPLTAENVMKAVAALLPENAIVADEGITSTLPYTSYLSKAAPHDYLPTTGGAIGDILPVSTGAAVAAPDRKVVCLAGDGSAMYTLQALWTQAREKLDVVTVIYANKSYSVLNQELKLVQAVSKGEKALSLLDLHNPSLDWVKLAEGMGVSAVSVDSMKSFADEFSSALETHGPRLIEVLI